jgi:hypothetical protein
MAGLDPEVVDPRAEAVFAAQADDLVTQRLYHGHQPERADVRLGHVEDLFRRAGGDEFGQDFSPEMAGILDAAVELAVGKRAGSAFSELHVALGRQNRAPPERPGVPGPLPDDRAAFQDDRAESHFRQDQSREQAARAAADHDRAGYRSGWPAGDRMIRRIRCRTNAGAERHGARIADRHIDGVDEVDGGSPARIVAASRDRPG